MSCVLFVLRHDLVRRSERGERAESTVTSGAQGVKPGKGGRYFDLIRRRPEFPHPCFHTFLEALV